MVLEVAILNVKEVLATQFEHDFDIAKQYISSIDGFISFSLSKCMEEEGKYILLVKWETLESHTIGFRESSQYQEWKKLLHHYYEPFPVVQHYHTILGEI